MKYNQPATIRSNLLREPTRTTNYEGAEAFTLSPKLELYERVLTCLMEPKFYDPKYQDTTDAIRRLVAQLSETDPKYILQLANYARNYMYLRSVPLFLLVLACKYPKTKAFVKAYTPKIVRRADELTEATALWIKENQEIGDGTSTGMMCAALKKGLADAFHNFDEYQLAKYNRQGAVKLRDVLRVTHPKPRNDEESDLWKRLLDDNLKIPDTWETYISMHGSTKENWEHIMPKMPIMATLRNLRNFAKVGADIAGVITKLENPDIIAKSKQFPFRFFSAYKALQDSESTPSTSRLMDAVQTAIALSVKNMPKIPGYTALSADNSGSMHSNLSQKGTVQYYHVANLLQAIAHYICEYSLTSVFGESYKVVNISKHSSILDNMERFGNTDVGHSTNGFLFVKDLLDRQVYVDRMIIFTDCQLWNSAGWGFGTRYETTIAELFRKYKARINPKVHLYLFNLAGYGTISVPERDAILVSGWTEKILKFINLFEADEKTMLNDIATY